MRSDSGHTTSVWMAADVPDLPVLSHDLRTSVCIVGAGIAGLTTAYLLARAGRAVVVIDDGPIGGGETGRSTAHITAALDDRYVEIEKLHGSEGARIAAESHTAAINRIESISSLEDIDCDFERLDGYLFLGGGDDRKLLEEELNAAHRAGLADVELIDRVPVGSFDSGPALRFPRQAQFHPLKYLNGLARAIVRDGGSLYSGTHAESIQDGEPATITTSEGHVITADSIVVATNSPVNDWVILHTKQSAYRTYVIAARIPRGSVPRALYWDTPDPYHYIRLQEVDPLLDPARREELLIVGGEDHKTGQADDAEHARRLIAQYRDAENVERSLNETREWWGDLLTTIQVKTPILSVDFMLNRWLLYQSLSCRIWGRSALYQSSGAYGFRDQLQDALALVYAAAPGSDTTSPSASSAPLWLESNCWNSSARHGVSSGVILPSLSLSYS